MKKKNEPKIWIAATVFMALMVTSAFAVLAIGVVSATTWYVEEGESIHAAVDAAKDGDAIIVRDGIYIENVDVNKRLTIKSEDGAASTIVQAADPSDHIFEVTADYVNISGFTVRKADHSTAGIYLGWGASHCNIFDNNVMHSVYGIWLDADLGNNIITNNTVSNNNWGISLDYSSNNTLTNNTALNNAYGIYLRHSSNNTLSNNNFSDNEYGIYLWDSNNIIYLNNFINNANNVYSSDSINTWNSPEKITYTYNSNTYTNYLGNYWSDYEGSDADKDGIGDTPYSIDSDKDNYPLMERFENYFKSTPTPTPTSASGKGIWIWKLSEAEGGDVDAIIERCENVGIVWVAIKCGDGGYFWSQCKLSTIEQFQNAGIKVFGWQYVYGDDPIGEANVANQILDLGVDGFIIDAEAEYEGKPDNAITYLEKIREEHSDSFIAYTPFPIIDYHTDFPYLEFGKYCDAVMPQDYWKEIGVTPEYMVEWMEEQWDKWHTIWEEGGYGDSIKPIIPLGQGWEVSGSEITIFCDLIYDHGYGGISLWRYGTMTEENWEAYAECFIPPAVVFDTGSGTYPSIMGTHTGTIKPNHTVIATKMYTYPCEGTGGHAEYAEIRNATWNATATWEGYAGDWHNITFDKTVVLLANENYYYTIKTGSYPQIIHKSPFNATGGEITCTKFTDANGKVYNDWIPAIRLWA